MSLRILLPTIWRLGPASVLDVALYRLACALGVYRRSMPIRPWAGGTTFFSPEVKRPPGISEHSRAAVVTAAESVLQGRFGYFSNTCHDIGSPPDWFLDPFNGSTLRNAKHWSEIDEFASCDIKNVWEVSRFQWLLLLAQAWRLTGDDRFISALNGWLADWAAQNPLNQGPNWKCAQEASIRLITLMQTARVLGTDAKPSTELIGMIEAHCLRIAPTMRYAIAQKNNHGTSEASALFIGGAWLMKRAAGGSDAQAARRWREQGRRWLENRVEYLIGDDGSFSQYSTNYQRLLIDTLSQVEVWRRTLQEPEFGTRYAARSRAALNWLVAMTDPVSGDAPNVGANDGSRLFDLSCLPYRDFRPSIQQASVLFHGGRAYQPGPWDEPLTWLEVDSNDEMYPAHAKSQLFSDGGFAVLRGTDSWGVLRFAAFRFRPSHADCLHLDLWHRGRNLLRDGGTFSYNTDSKWLAYFGGTASHNTVQFDGRDQMPRLGRFLFGRWLAMDDVGGIKEAEGSQSWSGAYTDWRGASHRRTVTVRDETWTIVDEISGTKLSAILRWRLKPDNWTLTENTCESLLASLRVEADIPVRRIELVTGWESRFYQEKSELPVLEIETGPGSCRIETVITLKD